MRYVVRADKRVFFVTDLISIVLKFAVAAALVVVAVFWDDLVARIICGAFAAVFFVDAPIRLVRALKTLKAAEPAVLTEDGITVNVKGKPETIEKKDIKVLALRLLTRADGGVLTVYGNGEKQRVLRYDYAADLHAIEAAANALGLPVRVLK